MLMRFAGIRKFSGSGSARKRSFVVQLTLGGEKWKQLHYSEDWVVEKRGQTAYKKFSRNDMVTTVQKADKKVSMYPLPIFSTVVATRFDFYV